MGSTNPVKLAAARRVFGRAFRTLGHGGRPTRVEVVGVPVDPGVPAQPVGAAQTLQGARTRALRALEALPGACCGVGIEAGVEEEAGDEIDAGAGEGVAEGVGVGTEGSPGRDLWLVQVALVAFRDGRCSVGWGAKLRLPPRLAPQVLTGGEELGALIDKLAGKRQTGRKSGAIGYLTGGAAGRRQALELMLACALPPLLHPELYDWPSR